MSREEIIRNLKYTMEKHKNDTVNTFDTNISVMCKDILDYLEQEPSGDAISREDAIKQCGFGMTSLLIADCLRKLPSVKPQPCEDAISRKALISHIENQSREWGEDYDAQQILGDIEDMQPVNPQDCDTCEVGNPCLYCKHEFEEKPTGSESEVLDADSN